MAITITALSLKHAKSNEYERGPALNKKELATAIRYIRRGTCYYDIDEGRLDNVKRGESFPQAEREKEIKALTRDVKWSRRLSREK